eukprot:3517054-Pyramimonas_sp.AAC.1
MLRSAGMRMFRAVMQMLRPGKHGECGEGTEDAVEDLATVEEFVEKNGLPVILKAAMGGGGRGMR